MRLVCPNCSAQYEIDGSMISDEGRDVQCSNCGHTWFELPPSEFEEPTEAPVEAIEEAEGSIEAELDRMEALDDNPEAIPSEDDGTSDLEDEPEEEDKNGDDDSRAEQMSRALPPEADDFFNDIMSGATKARPQPATDPDALDILREEADREMSQRRAPPSDVFEMQSDLDLDVRSKLVPTRALRARQAHLDLDEDDTDQDNDTVSEADEGYEEPRRDLLPDIDEINSTLQSTRRRKTKGGAKEESRGGFRFGFSLMLLLAIALVLAYVFAPLIVELAPGAEPALIKYVDMANQFRDWVASFLG